MPARIVTLFAPAFVLLLDFWPLKVASLWEYLLFTVPSIVLLGMNEVENRRVKVFDFASNQIRATGLSLILGGRVFFNLILKKRLNFRVTSKERGKSQSQRLSFNILGLAFGASVLSLLVGVQDFRGRCLWKYPVLGCRFPDGVGGDDVVGLWQVLLVSSGLSGSEIIAQIRPDASLLFMWARCLRSTHLHRFHIMRPPRMFCLSC